MIGAFCVFNPGNDLVSHKVALAVPSALRGLTSVFGMGTGVTLSVRSPETCWGKSGDRHRILAIQNSVSVPGFPQILDNSILMGKRTSAQTCNDITRIISV